MSADPVRHGKSGGRERDHSRSLVTAQTRRAACAHDGADQMIDTFVVRVGISKSPVLSRLSAIVVLGTMSAGEIVRVSPQRP